jgi:hypothetical protein
VLAVDENLMGKNKILKFGASILLAIAEALTNLSYL